MNFQTVLNTFLILLLAGSLLGATPVPARADPPCTWDGSSGAWSASGKWSCGHAPGVGDTAVINAGTVTVDAQVAVGAVSFLGGTLTGGTLIPNAAFDWQGGTLTDGTLFLPQTATLSLTGPGSRVANHHTFNNSGTATYTGGTLTLQNGTLFNNQADGVFTIQGDHALDTLGEPSTFGNAGIFRKADGSGDSQVAVGFNNTGQVDTQVGRLNFNGSGTSSGQFNTASGAENRFPSGTFTFNPGTTVTGAGVLRLNGGTLLLTGPAPVTVPNLAVDGGTLSGGALTLNNVFDWTGGTLVNGSLTITGTGTLNLSGSGNRTLDQHTVTHSGTTHYSGGTLTFQNGTTFNNQASGVFNLLGDLSIATSGAPSTFGNAGLLRKSGGGRGSEIQPRLNNTGKVETQSGQLVLVGGGFGFGEFNAASGAENRIAGGTYTLNGGATFTGEGALRVGGGTLVIDASVSATNFYQGGGTVNFPNASSSLAVSRIFNREGGTFNAGNGTLILGGGSTQVLSLGTPTTFNNLLIGTGTDLYETNPNQATLTGTLSNYGTLHAQQTITGPGEKKFGLTGVGLNVTTQGSLTQVEVQRRDEKHPSAVQGMLDQFWTLFATGSGFYADLALPSSIPMGSVFATICRYGDSKWDCAGAPNGTSVVRTGVTEFSDWTIYNPPERRSYLPLLAR